MKYVNLRIYCWKIDTFGSWSFFIGSVIYTPVLLSTAAAATRKTTSKMEKTELSSIAWLRRERHITHKKMTLKIMVSIREALDSTCDRFWRMFLFLPWLFCSLLAFSIDAPDWWTHGEGANPMMFTKKLMFLRGEVILWSSLKSYLNQNLRYALPDWLWTWRESTRDPET